MKKFLVFMLLINLVIFKRANSTELDATPSKTRAQQIAREYVLSNVFQDILDSDSSVTIVPQTEDENRFTFVAFAEGCSVQVVVSKETGMAFNDHPMNCLPKSGPVGFTEEELRPVQSKPWIEKVELVSATNLEPKADVLAGSKSFLIKIYFCGVNKTNSPRFQNLKINQKWEGMMGGSYSTVLKKTLELVQDAKQYETNATVGGCYSLMQQFELNCPIRPGHDGAGCELTINDQFVVNIENYSTGIHILNGYPVNKTK